MSTGCDLSEQYSVEEAAHVVKCTLLLGTGFSGRPAGSMPAPRLSFRALFGLGDSFGDCFCCALEFGAGFSCFPAEPVRAPGNWSCSRRGWRFSASIESFTLGFRAGRSRGVTWMSFWIGSCKGFGGSFCESESITFGFRARLTSEVTESVTALGISYGFSGGLGSTLQLGAWLVVPVTVSVPVLCFGRRICDCSTFNGGECEECSQDNASELHGDHCWWLELMYACCKMLK